MKVKYGSYEFAAGACKIATSQQLLRTPAQVPYAYRKRFEVAEGYLYGDSQSDLTTKIDAMKSALATPYQDLKLLQDDGSDSSDVLLNLGSITGVMITEGPDFGQSLGGEYCTQRSFSFVAEAEYPILNNDSLLFSWKENLSFSGGGPIYIHRNAINGPPQKQLIYPSTPYVVTQQGQAMAYREYPPYPGPIWPGALMRSPEIRYVGPDRMGLYGPYYQMYSVSWSYYFESIAPLVGLPTLWPI